MVKQTANNAASSPFVLTRQLSSPYTSKTSPYTTNHYSFTRKHCQPKKPAIDVFTIPASANYTTLEDLRLDRSTQQVVGRLICFWDARNINKNGEFLGIVLLFLDERDSIIHGFIPVSLANQYSQTLIEDAIFNIGGFEVGMCTKLYKITDHPFVLCFITSTTIAQAPNASLSITHEIFLLCNSDHLQALANTNHELPGNLYLNFTAAARFFLHTNIHAIQQFTQWMGIEASEPFVRTETKDGLQKKEKVSIAELYESVSNSNEQTQEADFLCKARVVGVLQRNAWSYVSCAGCSRKLSRYGSDLWCNKCVGRNVAGVARYRVELAVNDGKANATFVVFDTEMMKLTNKSAATIILESVSKNELPQCLQVLADKEFIFRIRVTPYNFTLNHRNFTVLTMTYATTF
ncbi:unnamed protein product [Thlaspi arvense]|uniref:Replication factor A C-terminal domain-containing protein n=1 Tax=Thlaspi arvense TaxID=13288 RepID=A0AAU9RNL5_THLAR|nr:unnamed protein product [Thlaspi arvense]